MVVTSSDWSPAIVCCGLLVEPAYIPALRYHPLTHWYDFIIKATIRESVFKSRLVEQVSARPGHHLLDLGCGTGTLTLMLKSRYPQAEVTGLDADPQVLALARAKTTAGTGVQFQQGMSFALPIPDQAIDGVVSSLMFHHLARDAKQKTLAEIRRVLRPGGQLHIADFGHPQNPLQRFAFLWVQIFDGFRPTGDNVAGRLPDLIRDTGFSNLEETAAFATMFGTIRLLQAQK